MRMSIALCVLALTGVALAGESKYRVVCYFASWSNYRVGNGTFTMSDIDPTSCSHLIYTFIGLTETGGVSVLDPWNDLPDGGGNNGFANFVSLRALSPETKFMVSMGGWNQGSATYSKVLADPELRSKLVQNIVDFLLEYDFNGFDFNWLYPAQREGSSSADVENLVLFLNELRASFDAYELILSAAVAAAEISASLSYDIPGISGPLDFISLMTYDFFTSAGAATGSNAPLYPDDTETTEAERKLNIAASVDYWLDQGAPAEKLNLGIPFFGTCYTLESSDEHDIGSPSIGAGVAGTISQEPGVLFYYEICERVQDEGWNHVYDGEQRVPYAYLGDQWISYDNVKSIVQKTNYIKSRGLGGAMIWTIDEDDFRGLCGEASPLLTTVTSELC